MLAHDGLAKEILKSGRSIDNVQKRRGAQKGTLHQFFWSPISNELFCLRDPFCRWDPSIGTGVSRSKYQSVDAERVNEFETGSVRV